MFTRNVSIFLTEHSAIWMLLICACTLVTELTSRKNRPLIPVPAASYSPWSIGVSGTSY